MMKSLLIKSIYKSISTGELTAGEFNDIRDIKWILHEGLQFVRRFESNRDAYDLNCHVALGGSVLKDGHSKNDLDIIVYPHKSTVPFNFEEIRDKLVGHVEKWEARDHSQYSDNKEVWKATLTDGRIIDFIILHG